MFAVRGRRRGRRASMTSCALLVVLAGCAMPLIGTASRDPVSDPAPLASPAPDWHVRRNRHNQCPRFEPIAGVIDCKGNVWIKDDWLMSRVFHGGGVLGRGYRSYRSAERGGNGGFQCTYDRDGSLVTNGVERGTYDYVRPDVSLIAHRDRDVRPHQRWPHAYEDPDRTQVYLCADCGAPD